MATIDMSSGVANVPAAYPHRVGPVVVDMEVDFAAATTAKGSALAANDVIQTLDIPAGCYIIAAGMQVVEAMTGTSTDLALDLGITGGDVDNFVDGFDFDAAAVGDYAAAATPDAGWELVTTADTLDILIAAQTGTFTGGKVRVFAVLMDVSGPSKPGIASAGS